MRVQVHYTTIVTAVVDTEAGTVERVVVWDDDLSPDRDDCAKDGRSLTTEAGHDLTDAEARALAVTIADDAIWPAWEFGC